MTAAVEVSRDAMLGAVADAEVWFRRQVERSWVPSYLAERNLPVPACAGYAPAGWTGLVDHARTLGYSDAVIHAAGLAVPTRRNTLVDRFRDRVMLSVRDREGDVVGFVGRVHPSNTDERAPRYVNSPAGGVYRKSDLLFGLADGLDALRVGATPVLVEGPFDALAVTAAGAGRYVGLAPCGTAFTCGQAVALQRSVDLTDRDLLIAFDGDPAGMRATGGAADLALSLDAHVSVLVVPDGTDPGTLHEQHDLARRLDAGGRRSAAFARVLAALEDRLETKTPEAQSAQVNQLTGLLADALPSEVGDGVVRIAQGVGVPVALVHQRLLDAVSPPPTEAAQSPAVSVAIAGPDLCSPWTAPADAGLVQRATNR